MFEVTIVVPTRNSDTTIRACLNSALAQTIPAEVIVVDRWSTDETAAISRSLGVRVISAGPERSAQRNRGALCTSGRWFLFVDSDMVLADDVVESCLRACKSTSASAAVVPEFATGTGYLARCRSLEKKLYLGDDDIEAARFFERVAFMGLGGFDEAIRGGGEDWDLPARLRDRGGKVVRAQYFSYA